MSKISFLLLTIFVAVASAHVIQFHSEKYPTDAPIKPSNLVRNNFTTRVNHFNPTSSHLAEFQYDANLEFWHGDGPIYVFVKPLHDTSTRFIEQGLMVDIARQTHGALVTFDTRYTGVNHVVDDLSYDNLVFLTVDQILADIARFVQQVRHDLEALTHASVIVYGTHTSASYAAWARLKYPHLIDAAWSSSGIFNINPFTTTVYDLLESTFSSVDNCADNFQTALRTLDLLVWLEEDEEIQQRLKLCDPVDTQSSEQVAAIFELITDAVIDYVNTFHISGVQNFCRDLQVLPSELDSLIRWAEFIYLGQESCFSQSYSRRVELAQSTDIATTDSDRVPFYIECTETGNFKTTGPNSYVPNHITEAYHLQRCADIFGEQYNPEAFVNATSNLLLQYGGVELSATRVIYTNGYLDPWLFEGVLFDLAHANDTNVFIIGYQAQSGDLQSQSGSDPAQLNETKQRIEEIILRWSGGIH